MVAARRILHHGRYLKAIEYMGSSNSPYTHYSRWDLRVGTKISAITLIHLFLLAGVFGRAGSDGVCKNIQSVEVVRLDDRSQRVFIAARSDQIDPFTKAHTLLSFIQNVLRDCRPAWKDSWSVSFFTERKFANYKTESDVEPFVKDGSWFRAYVGEYDRKTHKLSLNPLDPRKVKFLKVPLR